MATAGPALVSPKPVKPATVPGVLVECAISSIIRGFLVITLGGIAAGILGGILHDKIPSLPPGVSESAQSVATGAGAFEPVWGFVKAHRIWIVSSIFFAHAVWRRFHQRPNSNGRKPSRMAWRLERAAAEFSENWFWLLIGNAIGASVATALVMWAKSFSLTRILLDTVFRGFTDWLIRAGGATFGTESVATAQGLWAWFAANEVTFTFWVLFLGAMLDDLGLPNFKTWGRWLWRQLRGRLRPERKIPASAQPSTPPADKPEN